MRKSLVILLATAITAARSLSAQAATGCEVQPSTLKAMLDCYRPVLVFARDAKDPSFTAQQRLLEQYADDMMDRDLLYVPVLAQGGGYSAPLDAPHVSLRRSELVAIRNRFHVASESFSIVLVGKDGGEKFRSTKPVSVLTLDALVDAMPMGRQEKTQRSSGKTK